MDTSSHQNYTRKWANGLDVPIFCIDYRLAPKYPFPDFINDCYQAYIWIVSQASSQLGMDIDKFVFVGDSAGGHMTYSVTMLAMLRGFRLPDGILSIYPVFSLDMQTFYPSTLMTADDEIISSGFMSFCSACTMRKGGNPAVSLLASPIMAPDAVLRIMPKTHFIVCEIDGLRDQAYAM